MENPSISLAALFTLILALHLCGGGEYSDSSPASSSGCFRPSSIYCCSMVASHGLPAMTAADFFCGDAPVKGPGWGDHTGFYPKPKVDNQVELVPICILDWTRLVEEAGVVLCGDNKVVSRWCRDWGPVAVETVLQMQLRGSLWLEPGVSMASARFIPKCRGAVEVLHALRRRMGAVNIAVDLTSFSVTTGCEHEEIPEKLAGDPRFELGLTFGLTKLDRVSRPEDVAGLGATFGGLLAVIRPVCRGLKFGEGGYILQTFKKSWRSNLLPRLLATKEAEDGASFNPKGERLTLS